jgi:hypothetical protein
MTKIHVNEKDITILDVGYETYVSLTDLVRGEEGNDHIKNWMRNRNTVEFLGMWEVINNPDFKGVEFDTFRKEAGLNSFTLTPKKWIDATGAIGIISKSGKTGGGTFAHKDIALEFCTWLSPLFKLQVLKEFQRLKQNEISQGKWDLRRYLAKVNYRIQTDTIQKVLLPIKNLPKEKEGFVYAEEADLLYMALYGFTSKQWRDRYPELHLKGFNVRDVATTHELIILANLENTNSLLIEQGITNPVNRLHILRQQAIRQLESLKNSQESEHELIQSPNLPELSDFNQKLDKALKFNPKAKK